MVKKHLRPVPSNWIRNVMFSSLEDWSSRKILLRLSVWGGSSTNWRMTKIDGIFRRNYRIMYWWELIIMNKTMKELICNGAPLLVATPLSTHQRMVLSDVSSRRIRAWLRPSMHGSQSEHAAASQSLTVSATAAESMLLTVMLLSWCLRWSMKCENSLVWDIVWCSRRPVRTTLSFITCTECSEWCLHCRGCLRGQKLIHLKVPCLSSSITISAAQLQL